MEIKVKLDNEMTLSLEIDEDISAEKFIGLALRLKKMIKGNDVITEKISVIKDKAPRRKWTSEEKNLIIKLRNEGKSWSEMALKFGVPKAKVQAIWSNYKTNKQK